MASGSGPSCLGAYWPRQTGNGECNRRAHAQLALHPDSPRAAAAADQRAQDGSDLVAFQQIAHAAQRAAAMLPEHGQMTNTRTVAGRHFLRSLAASSTFLPAFSRGPLPIALS